MYRAHYQEHLYGGTPWFAWLLFALLLVVLIGLAAIVFSRLAGWRAPQRMLPAAGPAPADDPLAVLRLRYARGEIARDEFVQASTDLGAPPPA
jgi:uncharacterized membrane protein